MTAGTASETAPATLEGPAPGADARLRRQLLVIAGLALLVRVIYMVQYGRHLRLGWDATWYTGIGNSLAAGRGYSVTCPVISSCVVHQTVLFPPVLPLVYAATTKLGLGSILGRQLVLSAIDAATVFLVGLLGFRIGGRTVALVAAGLAAVNPMMILLDGSLMTETIAAFLSAVLLLLLVDQTRAPRRWRWFALGGVCGVAALTRGEGPLWLIVVVGPALFLVTKLTTRERLVGLGCAALTFLAVVAPWMARNQHEFGTPYLSQPNLYGTLAATNCRAGYYGSGIGGWSCAGAGATAFTDIVNGNRPEPAAYDAARKRAVTYASHHVTRLPVVVVAREARAWSFLGAFSFQTGLSSLRFSPTLFNWFLLGAGVLGALHARRRRLVVWPLLGIVASVTLTIAVTYGNPRYLASTVPALCVFAALAVATFVSGPARRSAAPAEA